MVASYAFSRAFRKNCPFVRMTKDEIEELDRLFSECMNEGRLRGGEQMREALTEDTDGQEDG